MRCDGLRRCGSRCCVGRRPRCRARVRWSNRRCSWNTTPTRRVLGRYPPSGGRVLQHALAQRDRDLGPGRKIDQTGDRPEHRRLAGAVRVPAAQRCAPRRPRSRHRSRTPAERMRTRADNPSGAHRRHRPLPPAAAERDQHDDRHHDHQQADRDRCVTVRRRARRTPPTEGSGSAPGGCRRRSRSLRTHRAPAPTRARSRRATTARSSAASPGGTR